MTGAAFALSLICGLPVLPRAFAQAPLSARELYQHKNNFRLLDSGGKTRLLSQYRGSREILVATYSPRCASSVPDELRRFEAFRATGLVVLLLDPRAADARADVPPDLGAPVLLDPSGEVARSFGLGRAGDFVLLDAASLEVTERGRLREDGESLRTRLRRDMPLAAASSAEAPWARLLSWARGRREEWTAGGRADVSCDFGRTVSPPRAVTRSDAELFQQACGDCHMKKPALDFFKTSADLLNWSAMIRRVLRMKTMPPPGPDTEYGAYRNTASAENLARLERRLAVEIAAGADPDEIAGARTASLKRQKIESSRWDHPALAVRMKRPDTIPARGRMSYRYVQLGEPTRKDLWIQAVRLNLNTSVTHHADLMVLAPGAPGPGPERETDEIFPNFNSEERRGSLRLRDERLLFTAGRRTGILALPDGLAYFVPKGSRFVCEIHYQSSGRVEQNRIEAEFYEYQGREPPKELKRLGVYRADLRIAAGEADHAVTSEFVTREDMTVYAFQEHMHLRGKSMRLLRLNAEGRVERVLFSIPYHQSASGVIWSLEKPLFLPRGTPLRIEAVYDNSADNPANPDPKMNIKFGLQTDINEMHIFRFFYVAGDTRAS